MIFVTVGSTDFDALAEKVDQLAPQLDTEVQVQIGNGQYVPRNVRYFRFAPSLDPYYDEAELIVGHGGLGTIVEALERGKRLVCVLNPTTYDLHQQHLLSSFHEQKYLLWCRDLEHLGETIQQAREMDFERYEAPPCHIHEIIADYLGR
jgi:beta-1,4-N-acetylglucosaminyltransferase